MRSASKAGLVWDIRDCARRRRAWNSSAVIGWDAIAERLEGGESGRGLRLRKRRSESYRGRDGSGMEEMAARDRESWIKRMREREEK